MRREALEDGKSLQVIVKHYLEPIIRRIPKGDVKLVNWLEQVMGVHSRPITRYTVKSMIKPIPGKLMITPSQGVKNLKKVAMQHAYVFVRENLIDSPDVVELELETGRGRKYEWFKMSRTEFEEQVLPKLRRLVRG